MAEGKREVYDTMFNDQAHRVLATVERIASARACPPAEVALNWILSHQEATVAIVGCDTPEQVDANMGATSWRMNDEERSELDLVSTNLHLDVR